MTEFRGLNTGHVVFRFFCVVQNPHIPVLFSLPRVLQLLGLFYTGLLPFVPLKEQFLEIPMPSIMTK